MRLQDDIMHPEAKRATPFNDYCTMSIPEIIPTLQLLLDPVLLKPRKNLD